MQPYQLDQAAVIKKQLEFAQQQIAQQRLHIQQL
jgi:hypothetical protein